MKLSIRLIPSRSSESIYEVSHESLDWHWIRDFIATAVSKDIDLTGDVNTLTVIVTRVQS